MIEHHWDFVDEEGRLHCNCSIGVIETTPSSTAIDKQRQPGAQFRTAEGVEILIPPEYATHEEYEAALRAEVKQYRESCEVLDEALTQCADANKDFDKRLTEAKAETQALEHLVTSYETSLAQTRAERDAAMAALAEIAYDANPEWWSAGKARAALNQPAAQDQTDG